MKLVRYGPAGKEKPGLIDADGKLRDLSKKVKDIDGATLAPGELAKLAKLDPKKLPLVKGKPRLGSCVAKPSQFVAIGLNYVDHAKETGSPIPENPIVFFKSPGCVVGPERQRDGAQELDAARLGGRARHRDRPQGELRRQEGRDEVRRRLLPDQRRVGARLPAEEGRVPVEQGQGLRHVRSARAVDGHEGRDQGRAEPRHVARRQRRASGSAATRRR